VDGVWQQEFQELPYFFPAADIERIEVIRSSAALINGVSGLTGIVNVVPKAYDSLGIRAQAQYLSFNTLTGGFSHGTTIGPVEYAMGAGGLSSDGPDGRNAAERNYDIYGRMKYAPSRRLAIQSNVFGLFGMRQFQLIEPPGDVTKLARYERCDPHRALVANTRILLKETDRASSSLLLFYTRRKDDFYRSDTASRPSSVDLDWEYGAHVTQALSFWDNNVLRIGGLYNNWAAPNGKRFYSGKPALVHTFSAVVADEQTVGGLTVDAGIRWLSKYYKEWAAYNINGTFVWKDAGKNVVLDAVTDTWEPPQFHGTAGLRYAFPKLVKLTAHYAVGQISPLAGTITAQFAEPGRETQHKVDAGVVLAHDAVGSATVTGFTVVRNNAISLTSQFDTAATGEILPFYENVDKLSGGGELVLKTARFFGTVAGMANVTLMRNLVASGDGYATDKEQPQVIVGGGVNVSWRGVDWNLYGKHVSKYESSRFGQLVDGKAVWYRIGDFSTLDMSLGYTLPLAHQAVRCFASAANLLDERYSTVVGYPDFGRVVGAGIQYSFGGH
jgi:outer membrane receptor protein involved in Fe transport